MRILLKQLSTEAIENCITCLNYKFDRVIFFGAQEVIDEEKVNIKHFLFEECEKVESEYYAISNDIEEVERLIVSKIKKENEHYIDLTGADGIINVALSNVAYANNIPMHIFDVKNSEIFSVTKKDIRSITDLPQRKIELNIEKYIKMLGGIVVARRQKSNKLNTNNDFIDKLISIKHKYNSIWTNFCFALQQIKPEDSSLKVCLEDKSELLKVCKNRISDKEIENILNDYYKCQLIKNYRYGNVISFEYCNEDVMQDTLEAGAILEEEVYKYELIDSDDCSIGIHLDWDGIVQSQSEGDVTNEVDVLRLDGYILTFISCKNNKRVDKNALYELETVTRRFGGKYSSMKLVYDGNVSLTDKERARLIGIKVLSLQDLLNQK